MSLEVKILHTRSWFIKAAAGIKAAELLLQDADLDDEVAFQCQQSIGKSIKGFRFWHDMDFRRTHDLNVLSQDCILKEPTLEPLLRETAPLNQYAVEYRYPGPTVHPTKEQLEQMLVLAKA